MNAPQALRSAADTVEACAISDKTDALIVLLARAVERKALGTCQDDELDALKVLLNG